MKFSLRVKFLLLSALVQALLVGLLIANSVRLMDAAVINNAGRVAHEYGVMLNLTLGPYASSGRLPELRGYMAEMLADQQDSFVRYVVITDADGGTLLRVGAAPADMGAVFAGQRAADVRKLQTRLGGPLLNARAPLLLRDNRIGMLNFGISTDELNLARGAVLRQGSVIAGAGFLIGLLLLFAFTRGMGRRLSALTAQSRRLAQGDFEQLLPERGGDELEVFARALNAMSVALRERIAEVLKGGQRLAESEARFRTLFETAPVPLVVTLDDGTLVDTNRALSAVFGHARADLLGKRSNDIDFWRGPDERARIYAIHRRDGAVRGEVAQARLANGRPGQVAIWSAELSLGGRAAIIWVLMDLTDELEAKRDLKELNASLEDRVARRSAELEAANASLTHALATLEHAQKDLVAAEKMASLGSLVAGVAHELNTPIGNSLLAATSLADGVRQFVRDVDAGQMKRSAMAQFLQETLQACELIVKSLHRSAHLIASFKQVAVDQTSDQRRPFDLREVLADTVATFAQGLRRANCEVRLEVDGAFAFDAYPGSLCQVLSNLLNNATTHAFGEGGGSITIRARAGDDEGWVEIGFADDGAGMPEHVLRHVFDPFFTTRMGSGGTGLGMNIVYNIVTGVLGGRIDVASAPGAGTTVRLVLPLVAPLR
ncbi:MAG: ATP-binding protein [Pseudomonadota bacterium]